jgi:glyceraldehyde-3-phosphate dehydrogenase/erythrose-4-phosphate dehydrogenase
MIKIGINGFGRIGKCCLLQLINNINFEICCLNALNITISEILIKLKMSGDYLNRVY